MARPPEVYVPLQWHIEPFRDKSPVLLLTGSAGGGKSRLAAEKIHAYCLKYPGATAIFTRKIKSSLANSTVAFMKNVVMKGGIVPIHHRSANRFEYPNGSVMVYGGMADEEQREALRSIGQKGGVDIWWMEEANRFTETDFNEVKARMRGTAAPWRQIILTTNPDAQTHWIYKDLIKGKAASVYYSSAKDNPHNPPDYLAILDSLTGILRDRLRDGLWRGAEGLIYDQFGYETHVKTIDRKLFKSFGIAVDEGYTNPAVALLIGHDADGRKHVLREFYKTGILQADFVNLINSWAVEFKADTIAVDAAAAGLIADLNDLGLPAYARKGRVLDGIRKVQEHLTLTENAKGEKVPRLTVDPSCEKTIMEFESYRWHDGKEEPVKENDHSCDAIRYYLLEEATTVTISGYGWSL